MRESDEGHPPPSPNARLATSSDRTERGYDVLAAEYARRLYDELAGKPLDRLLLDEVAARADGPICDLGCGPGHVARYLRERGASVCGVDVSPAMVAEARRRAPAIRFEIADMRSLPFAAGSLGAVVAMYSLIHFEEEGLEAACREVVRVLAPEGLLLAAFHRGSETMHVEELWGHAVDLDYHFFEPEEIARTFASSGLELERIVERDPYPGIEAETRRFYVLATRRSPERSVDSRT